jgi:hypothetical protein
MLPAATHAATLLWNADAVVDVIGDERWRGTCVAVFAGHDHTGGCG